MILTVVTKVADILGNPTEPNIISNDDSQMLYGEQFNVEKEHGAYVYGHSVLDGYKGYVERDQLLAELPEANAIVKARATHIYAEPNFKSRPKVRLSFLSRMNVTNKTENGFTQMGDTDWIFTDHIAPLKDFKIEDDLAQIATTYLGTPYIYAGRSSFGLDCSALVQQSMIAAGYKCPTRDSKDQQGAFGTSVPLNDKLQRNDVVYFDGHVGIMMDDAYILNATARHMSTVIENLDDLKSAYGDIRHIARI